MTYLLLLGRIAILRKLMRPVVTKRVSWSVGRSVTVLSSSKTVELIEMPFGIWTQVDPRKHALTVGAHYSQLAITTELSMCGVDAAYCQITLTTCC